MMSMCEGYRLKAIKWKKPRAACSRRENNRSEGKVACRDVSRADLGRRFLVMRKPPSKSNEKSSLMIQTVEGRHLLKC